MSDQTIREALEKLSARDARYAVDAYQFVCEALSYTGKMLNKPATGENRHISGAELLEGIRAFALEQFGPMTMTVLKSWGVTRSEDFGDMVFSMVDSQILGKTGKDRREDFANGYDFHDAFVRPFLPASKQGDAG